MFQIIIPREMNESGGNSILKELFDALSYKMSLKYSYLYIYKNQILEIPKNPILRFLDKRVIIKFNVLIFLIPNIIKIYKKIRFNKNTNQIYVCSHYLSCLPILIALITKVKVDYIFFIQASEWEFLKSKYLKLIIKSILKRIYLNSNLNIFTSENLKTQFEEELRLNLRTPNNHLTKNFIYPIWSKYPENYYSSTSNNRYIDILFCLRNGYVKAPKKYFSLFQYLKKKHTSLNVIGFAPNGFLTENRLHDNFEIRYNLNKNQIFDLYSKSKVFISLSRYEGFGLTSLEAMSCGCVPILLNNTGCWNYLSNLPNLILDSNSSYKEIMEKIMEIIVENNKRKILSKNVKEIFEVGIIQKSKIKIKAVNLISNFLKSSLSKN